MTVFHRRLLPMLVALCVLSAALPAGAETLGIVLMHGKEGSSADRGIAHLAGELESAGYLVERPTMCWSRSRIYDRAFLDCLADIDAAVASLKARGAGAIVVAGQSLGGAGALAYGARADGLAGVIALAPAPPPGVAHRPEIARELERARGLLASGHGDERQRFADINQRPITVETSARIYLSFLAPDAPANIVENARRLRAPLLLVAGDQDAGQRRDLAFDKVPSHPLNRYVTVHAGHFQTPGAAAPAMLAWLKDLAAQRRTANAR